MFITLEFESDAEFNLSSTEMLQAFLDSFNIADNNTMPTSDSSDDLSAGAIAGIAISVAVTLIIIVLSILAVITCYCKHSNLG